MKFGIVCKSDDPIVLENVKNVIELIKRRGHKFELESGLSDVLKMYAKESSIEKMGASIILAIGDDSTILKTFRDFRMNKKPVLGISCGASSFLSEIDINNFEIALKRIEQKKYFVEKRNRIAVEVDGQQLPFALNELTISAIKGATLIRYTLKVNGELVWRDSADGVILSTPTGSTGYALSAGGPVVSNESNVFIIIPICSSNQNKPYIVDDKSEIIVSDIISSTVCEAVIDGRYRVDLHDNIVKIKKSPVPVLFVRFGGQIRSRVFNKLKKRLVEPEIIPKNAPPSAKFIYKILQYEGPLTQKEIVTNSMLPARTVRMALNYLIKNNLITRQTSIRDTRQSIYLIG